MNAVGLRDMALRHGFLIVLVALLFGFSLGTPHFASLANLLAILHTMAPLVVMSAGLALVVLAGKLDISVGSVAFLSSTVAVLLMNRAGVPPVPAFAAAIVCGVALGALNGFIVVVLGVNSLIATLGTMIALRGVGLEATNATMIPLPESVRELGNVARRADLRRRADRCGAGRARRRPAPAHGIRPTTQRDRQRRGNRGAHRPEGPAAGVFPVRALRPAREHRRADVARAGWRDQRLSRKGNGVHRGCSRRGRRHQPVRRARQHRFPVCCSAPLRSARSRTA